MIEKAGATKIRESREQGVGGGKNVKSKASKKNARKEKRRAKKHNAKTKDSEWETESGEASEDDDTVQYTTNRINVAYRDATVSNQATDKDDVLKPWNAVCVLGLRIYSLDSDVSIQLIKPKDNEEADATM